MVAHHLSAARQLNFEILSMLGLRYRVFQEGTDGPVRVTVRGMSVVKSSQRSKGSIASLIEANVEEVHKIVSMFMEHDQGFARTIEEYINSEISPSEDRLDAV